MSARTTRSGVDESRPTILKLSTFLASVLILSASISPPLAAEESVGEKIKKIFSTPTPTPTPHKRKKIQHQEKRIGVAFADFVPQKEIRLSIAKRVSIVEGNKEIFANAGAERNATARATTDAFSFAYRSGRSRKRKARRAECDFVTGSDQWFRELSAKSAATSQFGTRTHDTQSGLQVRLSRSR